MVNNKRNERKKFVKKIQVEFFVGSFLILAFFIVVLSSIFINRWYTIFTYSEDIFYDFVIMLIIGSIIISLVFGEMIYILKEFLHYQQRKLGKRN